MYIYKSQIFTQHAFLTYFKTYNHKVIVILLLQMYPHMNMLWYNPTPALQPYSYCRNPSEIGCYSKRTLKVHFKV